MSGTILATEVISADAVAGLAFEVVFFAGVADLAVLAEVLGGAVFFAADAPVAILLAAFGVGVVVHCQLPFARAQAWPSFAVPYGSAAATALPKGSSSRTALPLFDSESLVSAEKYALNDSPASIDP